MAVETKDKEVKVPLAVGELETAWNVVCKLKETNAIDDKKQQRMGRKIVARLNRLI